MNTMSIKALEGGDMKVTVHSKGERDMSAQVTAEELDSAVRQAHNDHARGVFSRMPAEKSAEPEKPEAKKA